MLRILSILLLFISTVTSAQSRHAYLDLDSQKAKVGLVDEFIKRFNGIETHPNCPTGDAESRKKNLLMLLDLSRYKSETDSSFVEASIMMDAVISDSVRLEYSDSTWFAIARCKGALSDKEVVFDLFLNVEHKRKDLYKWSILHARGDMFNIEPRNTGDRIMIYPDDHETNFMSLMRMTNEQPFNVRQFMAKSFNYDATSVFAYLVHSGQLKISYVEKLEFVFAQIPGYIFSIENVERNTDNSGWLITNFQKCSNEEKDELFRKIHKRQIAVHPKAEELHTEIKDTVSNCTPAQPDLLNRRIQERFSLMSEYISFIKSCEKNDTSNYYQSKLIELFASDSKIILMNRKKKIIDTMSLTEFCDFIKGSKINAHVDYISIPVLPTFKIAPKDTSEYIYKTPGYLVSADCFNVQEPLTDSMQELRLQLIHTEDGDEWIPEFGNMIITIK